MAPGTFMSLCLRDNVEKTKVLKSRPLLKANTRAYCQQNQSSFKIKPQFQSSLTASPTFLPSLGRVCFEKQWESRANQISIGDSQLILVLASEVVIFSEHSKASMPFHFSFICNHLSLTVF